MITNARQRFLNTVMFKKYGVIYVSNLFFSLSTGLHMGRSNIKQVAQRRFHEISLFVKSLFLCAHEIAHSDLVYTFFHPLLRDQQLSEEYSKKVKGKSNH